MKKYMADDIKKIIEDTAEAAANKVTEQIDPLRKDKCGRKQKMFGRHG